MTLNLKKEEDTLSLDLSKLSPDGIKELADKLQFGLVTSLVESLSKLDSDFEVLDTMKARIVSYIERKITVEIESETLDLPSAIDIFSKLAKHSIDVAEVKRKVFNGKDLLKVDPLSKQERAMMDLLRHVNTPEKKKRLVEYLNTLDDFDSE